MPFENEHAARLIDPGNFVRFTRSNNRLGRGIDVIFGFRESGGSEIQAIRFKTSNWTAAEAREWLKDHDFSPILFEVATSVQAGFTDPEYMIISISDAHLEIEAKSKIPTFTMVAYAGNPIMQDFSSLPVIIDIESMIMPEGSVPILKDHKKEIGHTNSLIKKDNQILAQGVISLKNDESEEVITGAKNKFPWQASVRGPFPRADIEVIRSGEVRTVNGKPHRGPALVAMNMKLKEISILALGADDETSVNIAAQATQINQSSKEGLNMTDAEKKALEVKKQEELQKEEEIKAGKHEEEEKKKKAEEIKKAEELKKEEEIKAGKTVSELKIQEEIKASNKAYGENIKYRQDIEKLCNGNLEILAKAISENWTPDKTELEVIKAGRVQGFGAGFNIIPGIKEEANSMKSIEIAACMSMGVKDEYLVKAYSEKEVEVAAVNRGIGIKQIFEAVCHYRGLPIPAVFGSDTIRAAFTTIDLPDIFSNSLNKVLLDQYNAFPSSSVEVSMQSDVQDFKQTKRIRLVGTGELLKVAGDGELKSGMLSEDTFLQQIDTFGLLIWLTRQDIINDDLGAFAQITRMLGRKGIEKRETLLWNLVKAGETSTFFSSANNNLLEGTPDSVLSIDSLSAAVAAMAEQVDKDGQPVSILPRKLVVPPALESAAKALMRAVNTLDGSTQQTPNFNIHSGAFDVVVSPFLGSKVTPAGSDTAWYLMAAGDDIAAYDTAYLRGQRVPTVESGEKMTERMAINWRIFWDIGVAEQDFRAAVKSTGVA